MPINGDVNETPPAACPTGIERAAVKSMKKMKCLVKVDLNKNGLTLMEDWSEPAIGFDDVKIKVLAAAVCGTDKSIYNSAANVGIRREMQRYQPGSADYRPIIVGHEFCGIVEQVGAGVTAEHWKHVAGQLLVEPGDYVTAEMHLSCGHCLLCRTGNEHICINVKVKGVHLDGCFARSVVVPYKNVILLGKGGDTSQIPLRVGALMDAFGNAVHSVTVACVRGKSVAILGAGPLGLMAAFLCKSFGAARIYLSETADVERRFELATAFGADLCFDVSSGSAALHQSVRKWESGSNGVDVVLEMSGSLPAYEDAFKLVRNGGTVVLLGIAREPLSQFDIAGSVIWKGVTVKGIFGRKMFDTWETMLRLLRSNQFDVQTCLESIISKKSYKLDDFREAFEVLTSGKEMKLVFTP